MSDNLYAKIGRQAERIEQLDAAYDQLLGLLAKVITGELSRSRVLVNHTDRSWALAPEGQTPGTPAQFNGRPVCVVGVADEPIGEQPSPAHLNGQANAA